MKTFTNIWISCLVIGASYMMSCTGTDFYDPKAYSAAVENPDNGLLVKTETNGVEISLQYVPSEMIALNALGSIQKLKENYTKNMAPYEGAEYYDLLLYKPDESTKKYLQGISNLGDEKFELMLSFEIQKDISLVLNGDTLACSFLHREISDAITNKIKYSLAFDMPNPQPSGNRTILLNCPEFQLKNVALTIQYKNILSAPQLKIN